MLTLPAGLLAVSFSAQRDQMGMVGEPVQGGRFHQRPIAKFKQPTARTLTALERDLDDWYEQKKRGRRSRVFVFPKEDAIWFMVRHGDPLRREGRERGGACRIRD